MAERTYQQDRLNIQSYLNKTYKAEYCKDLSDFLNNNQIYDRIKKWKNEERL